VLISNSKKKPRVRKMWRKILPAPNIVNILSRRHFSFKMTTQLCVFVCATAYRETIIRAGWKYYAAHRWWIQGALRYIMCIVRAAHTERESCIMHSQSTLAAGVLTQSLYMYIGEHNGREQGQFVWRSRSILNYLPLAWLPISYCVFTPSAANTLGANRCIIIIMLSRYVGHTHLDAKHNASDPTKSIESCLPINKARSHTHTHNFLLSQVRRPIICISLWILQRTHFNFILK